MTYLLYNMEIYYQQNQCVLFNKESKKVYQRNTATGTEHTIGTAKTLKEAIKIAKPTIERLKHYYNYHTADWYI